MVAPLSMKSVNHTLDKQEGDINELNNQTVKVADFAKKLKKHQKELDSHDEEIQKNTDAVQSNFLTLIIVAALVCLVLTGMTMSLRGKMEILDAQITKLENS